MGTLQNSTLTSTGLVEVESANSSKIDALVVAASLAGNGVSIVVASQARTVKTRFS